MCYNGKPNFDLATKARLSPGGWINSGLTLKYTSYAMDSASHNGYTDVLQWWKDSGLPLKYSNSSMDRASYIGSIKVLQWWLLGIRGTRICEQRQFCQRQWFTIKIF